MIFQFGDKVPEFTVILGLDSYPRFGSGASLMPREIELLFCEAIGVFAINRRNTLSTQ